MRRVLVVVFIISIGFVLRGQDITRNEQQWVDSIYNSLSQNQKIGQLFMLRAHSNKGITHVNELKSLLKKNEVGGLCFFQGGPLRQAKLINEYQEIAQTPLLISMDAEYGLAMRLDSTFHFPFQMTLGAMDSDSLIYAMGKIIAQQLKEVGVQMNFAPVVDVNNNPNNPVINSRSFGEDKQKVAKFGLAYALGMQDNEVIAVAKHFPGHGDTDTDSHKALPLIKHDRKRLDSIELFPFKSLVEGGVEGMMIAHLAVPALGTKEKLPTTLSSKVVSDLLVKEMGFKGLKITDALEMEGVAKNYKPGVVAVKALLAGNDILLLPKNLKKSINAIQSALKSGELSNQLIEEKVKKILHYKYQYVLPNLSKLQTDSLYQKLNLKDNLTLSKEIFKEAITVVENKNNFIPIKDFDSIQIASFCIGEAQLNTFQNTLAKYTNITHFNSLKRISNKEKLMNELAKFDIIIVGIHNSSIFPQRNFGLIKQDIAFIDSLASRTKVILSLFASPYALNLFPNTDKYESLVVAYEDRKEAQSVSAQIIMGAIDAKGHLPVSTVTFPLGTGIRTTTLGRLQYGNEIEVGISPKAIRKVDSIVLANIKDRAMPGCQILMAKDGIVFFEKAYGYHTYNKSNEVRLDDLYDLASLTKIFATTISVMKLNQEKKLDIDKPLSTYLPYLKETNKKDIITRELMAHQARLKAWIPFYIELTDANKFPLKKFFKTDIQTGYSTQVADNLFIKDGYSYQLYREIANSKLRKTKKYKYSDLGFYLLKNAIENITLEPLDYYVRHSFYKPLGMNHTFFTPLKYYKKSQIIPSEEDRYFRHQKIQGYVHDPGAAILGGISGHAGLFSNANDLAKMAQLFLQKGYYGGKQYIDTLWIEDFTKTQYPINKNRRGIGFDRPEEDKKIGPSAENVSDLSFGHSGFTGTYFWVDPQYNFVYVFLSNRTYPTAENRKLIKNDVRTNIMETIIQDFKNN